MAKQTDPVGRNIIITGLSILGIIIAMVAVSEYTNHQKEKYSSPYVRGAELGDAEAQNNLGNMYYVGQGVEQDYAEALRLYELAAEQGYASAQNNLGYMYSEGLGVEQDYAEALRLRTLAAEQGNAKAQSLLGYIYKEGLGVEQDYAEALRLYKLAADQGDATAQNNLGAMYAEGLGVEQDYAEAVRLYELAANSGFKIAHENLEALKARVDVNENSPNAGANLLARLEGTWHAEDVQYCKDAIPPQRTAVFKRFEPGLMITTMEFGADNACHSFVGGCDELFDQFPLRSKHDYTRVSEDVFQTEYMQGQCEIITEYQFITDDELARRTLKISDSCDSLARESPRDGSLFRCE
jgi:hypothetical protein